MHKGALLETLFIAHTLLVYFVAITHWLRLLEIYSPKNLSDSPFVYTLANDYVWSKRKKGYLRRNK